ncbi:tyrosine-type recombinase/integrase [Cupriavidus cauae]|uniref:Integrase family protein n=1 Tax=Cupriavidus cauae TaxID=2608999 RepID=A0A5M8AQR0_9BURK|nr:integrase family protein [Cupriavidus cauae]KAA6124491.1 integrase family protein [Cupriavidus cauae]
MARVTLTAGRVQSFQCAEGASQSFLWDNDPPQLAVRATANGAKAFVFQGKIRGRTVRLTIGGVRIWGIDEARKEARRLQQLIDDGKDPRQVKADAIAAEQARREAEEAARAAELGRQQRESVTLGDAWTDYVKERTPHWSELHLRDHQRIIQAGGEKRKRSAKLTEPGPLASLAGLRLVDLTPARLEAWARLEGKRRPARARLALRLLKACLGWCAAHPVYAEVARVDVVRSKKARECLGKPQKKENVLQREQLEAWFVAVRQIDNPIISAYLQVLLLTGARREELAGLRWQDVDFRWKSIRMADKIEGLRMVPLTPYVARLLDTLPRRNEWVFSSLTSKSGRLTEPSIAHRKACAVAGLDVSLHDLRRSFATLSEWIETPAGIAAQIQGHAPQGVREQNYIRRPLDLLRMWHSKIEAWLLAQARVAFDPAQSDMRLSVVA